MARTNYGQAKRQKELARKARQQEKMTRRATTRPQDGETPAATDTDVATVTPDTTPPEEGEVKTP
jgi:hypothetical protein